jgi:crotonobetainyl-CoA:carnitine CoA-transferase CaiB-like acyl-CoA transferase
VYLTPDGPSEYDRLDRDQTGLSALYRLYQAQGGWVQLAAVRPQHFSALCGALARPELETDPRFATPEARAEHRNELSAELEPVFMTRTPLQWRRALDTVGVPCEIAADTNDGETVLFDDELLKLGIVAETNHRDHGRLRQVGQLVRLVDDLLDLSRITHNRIELRKERVELASVLYQAIEASRLESAGRDEVPTRPEISADDQRVRRSPIANC